MSVTFEVNGETFDVPDPADFPFMFWDYLRTGDLKAAFDHLLDDEAEVDRFWQKARPSTKRIAEMTAAWALEMGDDLGKSMAPLISSNGATITSTPTSAVTGV